jgi:hypothetical protein
MSNQILLRSTQPNNSLRGGVEGVPSSRIYQEKTNQMLPFETLAYSNDVKISLNTHDQGSTAVVRIPNQYRLVKQVILEVELAEAITTSSEGYTLDYKLHEHVERFSYRLAGAERMDFEPFTMVTEILNDMDDNEKKEHYRELNGRAFKTYAQGSKLYMICGCMPGSGMSTDLRYRTFPMPLHLTGESLEITFKFGKILHLSSAAVQIVYGDLSYANEYKNTVYRYNFKARYGYTFPSPGVTARKSVRRVQLLGLRPGETNALIINYVPSAAENELLKISGTSANTSFPTLWALRPDLITRQRTIYGSRLSHLKLYYLNQLIWDLDHKSNELFDIFQAKKRTYFTDNFGVPVHFAFVTNAPASTVALGHPSGRFGTNIRVNSVTNGNITTDDPILISSKGYSGNNLEPYKVGSYYYVIPISELLSEFTNNGYSLGADFTHAALTLEFVVDSEDSNTVFSSQSISAAHAEDVSTGHLHVTQEVQSIYQFMGSTVSLIQ